MLGGRHNGDLRALCSTVALSRDSSSGALRGMTALELLRTLHELGVTLTPMVDRLRIDAPMGVLTAELRQALRVQKWDVLDMVEAFEERSALVQYYGDLPRPAAEA